MKNYFDQIEKEVQDFLEFSVSELWDEFYDAPSTTTYDEFRNTIVEMLDGLEVMREKTHKLAIEISELLTYDKYDLAWGDYLRLKIEELQKVNRELYLATRRYKGVM